MKVTWIHFGKALMGNVVSESETNYTVVITSYEIKRDKNKIGQKWIVAKSLCQIMQ